MKRKRLYLLLTGLLLISIFSINVIAEENPESELGFVAPSPIPSLDSYFYNNYVLLPYIEGNGSQYINSGVYAKNNLCVSIQFSDIGEYNTNVNIFGSVNNNGSIYLQKVANNSNNTRFNYGFNSSFYTMDYRNYNIYNITYDKDKIYINGELIYSFNNSNAFNNEENMYIFGASSVGNLAGQCGFKLYKFSVYDYSPSDPNDNESDPVGYVKYYYPARSKSGNVVGLYDAVSKTFITSSSQNAFVNPTGSDAELSITAGITTALLAGLGWIGQIMTFAKSNTVILIFLAIGLAGVAFRWARRVVHF